MGTRVVVLPRWIIHGKKIILMKSSTVEIYSSYYTLCVLVTTKVTLLEQSCGTCVHTSSQLRLLMENNWWSRIKEDRILINADSLSPVFDRVLIYFNFSLLFDGIFPLRPDCENRHKCTTNAQAYWSGSEYVIRPWICLLPCHLMNVDSRTAGACLWCLHSLRVNTATFVRSVPDTPVNN